MYKDNEVKYDPEIHDKTRKKGEIQKGFIGKDAIQDLGEATARAYGEKEVRDNLSHASRPETNRGQYYDEKFIRPAVEEAAEMNAMAEGYNNEAILELAEKAPEDWALHLDSPVSINLDTISNKSMLNEVVENLDPQTRKALVKSLQATIELDGKRKQARGGADSVFTTAKELGLDEDELGARDHSALKRAKRITESAQKEAGGSFSLGQQPHINAVRRSELEYQGDTIDFDHGR